jgi:hypothetical protein
MIGWISDDVCFIVTGGNIFVAAMIGWISGDVGFKRTLPPVTINQHHHLSNQS